MNRTLRSAAAATAAFVLAGLIATAGPALAAPIADGTSNTLQFGITAATFDGLTSGDANAILYNGHAGLGGARFNVPDVTVIPPI